MATYFEPGPYQVQVINQCFTNSTQKGTLGFVLTFRVLRNVDQPEVSVKSYQRDMTWWITDNTVKRVLHDLHFLGYTGTTLAGVDPDSEGFHSFRDLEIELICTHEANGKGDIFERWNVESRKANLKDKSLLRKFDRILNPEQERVNSGVEDDHGITDADVPF